MRRASLLLIASSLLAGAAALPPIPASAQDASGPSTSGGSLPYISGQGTAKKPEEERPPAAKTQATSPGTPAAAPPRVPGPLSADKPLFGPKPTEPAVADKPVEPAAAGKPAEKAEEPVRKIEITKDRPPQPPNETTAGTPPKPPADETRDAEASPADKPRREAAPKPTEPRKRPTVAETRPARPQPQTRPQGDVAARDRADGDVVVRGRDGRVVVIPGGRSGSAEPYGGDEGDPGYRVGRPYEPRSDRDYVDRRRGPAAEEDAYLPYPSRRWSERFVYTYPYYRPGTPVLRPYAAQPYAYYRQAPRVGGNCHYHAYPAEGAGPFHREIRCHWHEEPDDPSLRYAR
ncbi:hypothetical protein [Prosthecomicrobium sp. N25]|uniref:hypothetical protein n=1 Tax=Prosthecomicrobium sp. N25 TaxID=3129254 RepID=UPI0030769307